MISRKNKRKKKKKSEKILTKGKMFCWLLIATRKCEKNKKKNRALFFFRKSHLERIVIKKSNSFSLSGFIFISGGKFTAK